MYVVGVLFCFMYAYTYIVSYNIIIVINNIFLIIILLLIINNNKLGSCNLTLFLSSLPVPYHKIVNNYNNYY